MNDYASNSGVRITHGLNVPVLMDFWAPWCGPCIFRMRGLISAAERADGRYVVACLNADEYLDVSKDQEIRAFPTMVRYARGEETGRSLGAKSVEQIVSFGADNEVPPGPYIS